MSEARKTDDEIDRKVSQMVATQRLSKDAPKTIGCPHCDRMFVNDYALNAHRKALGH